MPIDLTYADETVARVGRKPEAVIPVLQALQEHYGYLPEEALHRVCEASEITPAAIAGVIRSEPGTLQKLPCAKCRARAAFRFSHFLEKAYASLASRLLGCPRFVSKEPFRPAVQF